ncbi:NTP transferase domain-containing protein [Halalkalibacter lacteus]|uniref:NTP transferase domain-containing protein n=1 Tax=Halalkalibacter lacteus TaxID=3090663 RepID=UPI002FC6FCF1
MIFGIYLAAGQSKRMGCPKLSLPLDNKPLGSIALETAIESALEKVLVVTRESDSLNWLPPHFFQELSQKKWVHIRCKESWKGQAESLKCGLTAAQKMHAKAVMILLADQPFVTQEIIDQIVTQYKTEKPYYIASCYNGMLRPPVIFNYSLFPKLFQLHGDEGARQIIRNSNRGLTVEFKEERNFLDVDTSKEYKSLKKLVLTDPTFTQFM